MKKRIALTLLPLPFLAIILMLRQPDAGVGAGSETAASPVPAPLEEASVPASRDPAPLASAAGPEKETAATAVTADDEEEKDIFSAFADWAERYVAASSAQARDALMAEGLALAAERREALKEMIQVDPEAALREAIPYLVRQELPEAVAAMLEQKVGGLGDLDVFAVTPKAGQPLPERPVFHQFETGGERFDAFIYGDRLADRARQDVSAHGIEIDGLMAMHEDPFRVLEAGEPVDPEKELVALHCDLCEVEAPESLTVAPDSESGAVVVESGTKSYFIGADGECYSAHMDEAQDGEGDNPNLRSTLYETLGEKSVLVIRVTFDFEIDPEEVDENGDPIEPPEPATEEDAYETMVAINEHYRQASHQQFSFNAIHVTPLYMMGGGEIRKPDYYWDPAQNVDRYLELYDHAREAAAKDGYSFGYDFVIVAFPDIGFPWAGLGRVGAKRAWIQQTDGLGAKVTTHELGHNFGLFHAGLWRTQGPVGTTPIGSAQSIEYGNVFDMMGSGGFPGAHFNGNFKSMMDWIPSTHLHSVPNEEGTDVYRIHRLDGGARLRPGHHYTTRIVNPNHTSLPEEPKKDYWLDFRQLGSGNPRMLDGIVVQWGDGGPGQGGTSKGSHLLNMNSNLWLDFPDDTEETPLAIGETFSDQILNIHVTPLERGGAAGPDEYIDVLVTRGLLKIEITEPIPDPWVGNPTGIIDIPGGDPFELVAAVEVSASPVDVVEFLLDGESLGTAEADPDGETYRFQMGTRGHNDEVKTLVAKVTNEAGNTVVSEVIYVRFDSPPLLVDFHVEPTSVSFGETILFSVVPDEASNPVRRVEFLVDEQVVATVDVAPFEYEWLSESQGTFQVAARAYDFEDEVVDLGPVAVTVTTPVSEDVVFETSSESAGFGETLTLTSGLDGRDGDVQSVEFFADGESIGEVSSAPFSINWAPVKAGDRRVWAVVTDTDGSDWSSVIRTIVVARPVLSVTVSPSLAMPGETVTLTASSDVEGWNVAEVIYRVDGANHAVRTDFESPVTLVAPQSGVVPIEVRAHDAQGNQAVPAFANLAVRAALTLSWTEDNAGTDRDLFAGASGAGGRVVVAGSDGTVRYSDDGIAWTGASLPTAFTVRGLAYGAGRFVAVGAGGNIATSSDGEAWEERTSGVSSALRGVGYDNGLFLAVGDQGVILRSSDGLSWDQPASPVNANFRAVEYGFGKWFIVGSSGTILSSDNSVDWTALPAVTSLELRGITFGKGTLVAAGGRQLSLVNSEGIVLVSFDGETWETQSLYAMANAVHFGNNAFVAPGFRGELFTSYEGVMWRPLDSDTTTSFYGAVTLGDRFLAHGGQGSIWRSEPIDSRTTSYRHWVALQFGALEILESALTDPAATVDGNAPNLLRYALDLAPGETPAGMGLGRIERVSVDGEDRIGLIYRESLIRDDLVITPEISADLSDWAPLNAEIVEITEHADYIEVTVVEENEDGTSATRFYRLSLNLAAPW